MTDPTTTVVREGLSFGEAPRWHDGRLWYSDFYDHAVHALAPDGTDERVLEVPAQPSGLGWLPDGSMLIVSMRDRRVLRQAPDGSVSEHADLSGLAPFHCNDMVVDAVGRAYVGNFGFDIDAYLTGASQAHPSTVLIRVDPDGTASVAAEKIRFPNGAVITPDGSTLILAETMGCRLTAFAVAADGTLGDRRIWADLREIGAYPDGICLDASGAVWVANSAEPVAYRVAEGGEILETVTWSQHCYACMLGGGDGRTLYAMTAPSSVASEVAGEALGRIEAAQVTSPHAGWP